MAGTVVELVSQEARCRIAPALGGALLGFSVAGEDYLRPAPDAGVVTESACFPMVPYCNRIPGGAIRFGDASWPIEPNFGVPPAPCHGDGWQSEWVIDDRAADALTLSLHSSRAPYAFTAWQSIRLQHDALQLSLTVRNDAGEAMPMGLGFHPFFADSASATVTFTASRFWLEGPDKLPTEPISLPPELDHRAGRRIEAWRNNSYAGWDGRADVIWKDGRRVVMEGAGEFAYLHVYHPPTLGFFCLEPQTHLSGALGRVDGAAHGVRLVQPGGTMSVSLRFTACKDRR